MALQMMLGFDDTIPEDLSTVGGTSGVTGRAGIGLAGRRAATATVAQLATLPTALSTLYFGMAFRSNAQSVVQFLRFLDGGLTVNHVRVAKDNAGTITLIGPANTVVATSAVGVIAINTWYYLEIKLVIHDTLGVFEARLNESVIATFSGDTRNGAPTTAQIINIAATTGENFDFDDVYVDDAGYLGDVTVVALSPDGNGSSSDWVGSDGNSTDNYLLVDDPTTSSMADYVGASASGKLDLYTMSDLPAGYSVLAIQELIYAQKSDAGTPPTLLPVAKGQSGTTRTDTALPSLSTTAAAVNAQIRTTDPDGNALTAARVNAMEVGVKIS